MISPELRADLDSINLELETLYKLTLGEQDLCDLSEGYVPRGLRAVARTMLEGTEQTLEDLKAREVARKVRTRAKRKKAAA